MVREQIIKDLLNPELADMSIRRLHHYLQSNGIYRACERTYYRIAKEIGLSSSTTKKKKSKKSESIVKTQVRLPLKADGPNQVWVWDISYFKAFNGTKFVYLFAVMDLYSRKIVHAKFYDNQEAATSVEFFKEAFKKNGITPATKLHIHSDNGSAMRSELTVNLFKQYGVELDTNRPLHSNDNPHIESYFGTVKGPYDFKVTNCTSLEECNERLDILVHKYNFLYPHSALNGVPPGIRHDGVEAEKAYLKRMHDVHKEHFEAHAERYPRKYMRSYERAGAQYLSPTARQVSEGIEKDPRNRNLRYLKKAQERHHITAPDDHNSSIVLNEVATDL